MLRAFLGRLTETLMASDWINHACRKRTLTLARKAYTGTHARLHDPCSPTQCCFSLTLIFMLSLRLDTSVITLPVLAFYWPTVKVIGFMVKGQGLRVRLMCVKARTGCEAGL